MAALKKSPYEIAEKLISQKLINNLSKNKSMPYYLTTIDNMNKNISRLSDTVLQE